MQQGASNSPTSLSIWGVTLDSFQNLFLQWEICLEVKGCYVFCKVPRLAEVYVLNDCRNPPILSVFAKVKI